jgi:hypothetical protein
LRIADLQVMSASSSTRPTKRCAVPAHLPAFLDDLQAVAVTAMPIFGSENKSLSTPATKLTRAWLSLITVL